MSTFHGDHTLRALLLGCLGVAAAGFAVEIGLRPFTTADGPPSPRVEADSMGQPGHAIRQYDEGVSVASFSHGGARLTGDAPIAGAPMIVLLGDSYVVARAVADNETMGARLERDARAGGVRLNVRQYGWLGASPSRYLINSRAILQRWDPSAVVIVLSDNDLDGNALWNATPRLRVTAAGVLEVAHSGRDDSSAPGAGTSALASALRQRTWEFSARASRSARLTAMAGPAMDDEPATVVPDSAQLRMLPSAVVHALSAAFGDRLSLLYLAEVRLTDDDSATSIERSVLAACREVRLRCASTREEMLAARARGVIARGFFNTTPGNGHLNAAGHAIAGDAIWAMLQ
ncbi:MAG TPA: hypothetical protein VK636_01235 [Gemmatimonadaceae bacterium]|nr:hypothetical protein [Gemmatimonadaceae bacterium]